jgi:EAL domain-containing protein (putative c-di-GMP-specific phosphodiesterase class I)
VAEGVETSEEAVRLRGMSCEYAQGYFFGAPLPPADVLNFITMAHMG